jgi:hypothetical protein
MGEAGVVNPGRRIPLAQLGLRLGHGVSPAGTPRRTSFNVQWRSTSTEKPGR